VAINHKKIIKKGNDLQKKEKKGIRFFVRFFIQFFMRVSKIFFCPPGKIFNFFAPQQGKFFLAPIGEKLCFFWSRLGEKFKKLCFFGPD
jgi:hypothetical protein